MAVLTKMGKKEMGKMMGEMNHPEMESVIEMMEGILGILMALVILAVVLA